MGRGSNSIYILAAARRGKLKTEAEPWRGVFLTGCPAYVYSGFVVYIRKFFSPNVPVLWQFVKTTFWLKGITVTDTEFIYVYTMQSTNLQRFQSRHSASWPWERGSTLMELRVTTLMVTI